MKKIIIVSAIITLLSIAYTIAANEVTINTYLKVKSGAYEVVQQVSSYQDSQLTNSADQGVVTINTVQIAVPIINVKQPKWTYLRNTGTNGSIDVTCTIRLGTNDMALLPITGTNIQAVSVGATTNKLIYWINEK